MLNPIGVFGLFVGESTSAAATAICAEGALNDVVVVVVVAVLTLLGPPTLTPLSAAPALPPTLLPRMPLPLPESRMGSGAINDDEAAVGAAAAAAAGAAILGVISGAFIVAVEDVEDVFCGRGGAFSEDTDAVDEEAAAPPLPTLASGEFPPPMIAAIAAALGDSGRIGVRISNTSPGP